MGTSGKVFPQRYHDVVLTTPRRTRRSIAYVLNNARRHRVVDPKSVPAEWVDPCSSAARFEGWRGRIFCSRDGPPAGATPGTWLLSVGWKRGGGRIPTDYVPVAGR